MNRLELRRAAKLNLQISNLFRQLEADPVPMERYVLDEKHKPVRCYDILEWGKWMQFSPLRVVKTEHIGDFRVSTVFLGLDHRLEKNQKPLLFETMTFHKDDWMGMDQVRYHTWKEAMKGHRASVRKLRTQKKHQK